MRVAVLEKLVGVMGVRRARRVRLAVVSAVIASLGLVVQSSGPVAVRAAPVPATFKGLTPARLLDTRPGNPTFDGLRAGEGPLGPAGVTSLQISGRGGVPTSGAGSVALNITAVGSTAQTYVTVWPTGLGQPGSSNLNVSPGVTTPNMVIVPLGTVGKINLANDSGDTDLVVDVLGYFPTGGGYQGLQPERFLDTRPNGATCDDAWVRTLTIGSGADTEVQITGRCNVPATGVDSVAVNLTVTGPTKDSYMTVWPSGLPQPNSSTLNYVPGQTVANMAIVPVGTALGRIDLWNFNGVVFGIADVLGYFPSGSGFHGSVPKRFMDTRAFAPTCDLLFSGKGVVGPASTRNMQLTGRCDIPATGVGAVALNVTVTAPTAPSFMTVWPSGVAQPTASNLNYVAGQTVPNMVIVPVGADGQISLFNSTGQTHVIVDVLGWFAAS